MNEYSITSEELQEIMELITDGWKCEKFEANSTLYVKLTDGSEEKDYEFVRC